MATLKSIVPSITVTFTPKIMETVESNCRREWAELHRLDHPNEDASPFIPATDWLATREGKMHFDIFQVYFTPEGLRHSHLNLSLDNSELNMILSRLQAQRYNVQGKRKIFEVRVRSNTAYRKFRTWWINKWVSELAGFPFNEACPFEKYAPPAPPESYIIIGEHFEEWTGYKLPPSAWEMLKDAEANRLMTDEERAKIAEERSKKIKEFYEAA